MSSSTKMTHHKLRNEMSDMERIARRVCSVVERNFSFVQFFLDLRIRNLVDEAAGLEFLKEGSHRN